MATKTATGGLSRITIVAPRTRMDLALPSDVPLADLLPTLLRYAGEDLADEGVRHGGWALSRLGGAPLDGGRTAAQLGVRDGEVLYFNPRSAAAPEIVFDDVVDAVATATNQRPAPGRSAPPARFAVLFAAADVRRRRGRGAVHRPAAPARRAGRPAGHGARCWSAPRCCPGRPATAGPARCWPWSALGYAGVGGLLLLAGDRRLTDLASPHVLLAGTAVIVARRGGRARGR